MKNNSKIQFTAVLAGLLVFQFVASLAWPARAVWASPSLPAVDISVGPGCTYPSIGAAVAAASPGSRLLIDKSAPFFEHVMIAKNLTLVGGYTACASASTGRSTIDGSNTGVVLTINPAFTVILNNLNITHGSGAAGGGIYADHSTLTLDNSAVSQNTASGLGGGIRLVGGTLTLQNNTLIDGNAAQTAGGGIAASGTATINISNTTFQNNSAGTDGGAIYLNDSALNFTGWWNLSLNTAGSSGGAVAIDGAGTASFRATTTKDSELSSNQAAANGGALYSNNNNTVQLYAYSGFTINLSKNHATGSGGAIYANAGAFFDVWGKISAVMNVAGGDGGVWYLGAGAAIWMTSYATDLPQILANQAQNGGAIFATDSPRVECDDVVFGSLANGNTATTGSGGAISVTNSSLFANNCVFQYNTAALNGGAIAATDSSVSIGVAYPALAAAARPRPGPPGRPQVTLAPLVDTGCPPVFHECSSFHHNSAAGLGGAIYALNTSSLIDSTYLHDNQAANGAAIDASGNTTQIINSVFHHNSASGALAATLHAATGNFTVKQVTIADNSGIGFAGEPAANTIANNTISWGNTANGYDHIGAVTCSIGTGGGIGALNKDPKFYGNGDYRPWRASPAIDACQNGLAKDINNYARPYNTLYDMGAFEYVYKLTFIVATKK